MEPTVSSPVAPYGAYFRQHVPEEDKELTTSGRAPLRRIPAPLLASRGPLPELQDLPRAVRILGEDLVLFRDGQGQIGLLMQHCSHRGTSLKFALWK